MKTLEQLPLPQQTLRAAAPECALEVTASQPTPAILRLHYRVYNHSALPLYLCNQLYKSCVRDPTTGELIYEVQPNLTNVCVTSEHVTVGKAVVDVPEWMFVEALQIPCLCRVLPGEQWEETIELPLPLMPYTVYDYSPATGKPVARQLRFEIGYFLASPHTERFITTVRTPSGKAYHIDPFPASDQSLLIVGPWPEQVVVVGEE